MLFTPNSVAGDPASGVKQMGKCAWEAHGGVHACLLFNLMSIRNSAHA
jgi:hypothetical protein